jgi:hypothetical protein
MRLDNNGNLGIGTSSPTRRLFVNGSSNLGGSVNSVVIGDGTFAVGVASIAAESGARLDIGTAGANPLLFFINNTERARLDSSGNLGIGTGGQTARGNLDISSGADAGASTKSIHLGYSAADFYGFRLVNTNTPSFSFAGTFEVQRGNGSTWLSELSVDNAGNVCAGGGNIGTTATNRFLYVPTCAGVPTGTPTAKTGYAPIVVDTTNNKLYFYSGGAWRDAGP